MVLVFLDYLLVEVLTGVVRSSETRLKASSTYFFLLAFVLEAFKRRDKKAGLESGSNKARQS